MVLNIPEKEQLVEQRYTVPGLKEELVVPLVEKVNEKKGKLAMHLHNLEKALELVKVYPEKEATLILMKKRDLKAQLAEKKLEEVNNLEKELVNSEKMNSLEGVKENLELEKVVYLVLQLKELELSHLELKVESAETFIQQM